MVLFLEGGICSAGGMEAMEKDVEVTETVEQADMPRGTDEEDGKGKPGGGGGHRI